MGRLKDPNYQPTVKEVGDNFMGWLNKRTNPCELQSTRQWIKEHDAELPDDEPPCCGNCRFFTYNDVFKNPEKCGWCHEQEYFSGYDEHCDCWE